MIHQVFSAQNMQYGSKLKVEYHDMASKPAAPGTAFFGGGW